MLRVYLDNCCYNRPYDNQNHILIKVEAQAKVYIQEMIKAGKLELATSFILWYELSQNPIELRKKAITDFLRANTSVFINTDSGRKIKTKADQIMETGVKMKDAYHIASAIASESDYFITTDKRLLKYQTADIKIVNPLDFLSEMGEENDE